MTKQELVERLASLAVQSWQMGPATMGAALEDLVRKVDEPAPECHDRDPHDPVVKVWAPMPMEHRSGRTTLAFIPCDFRDRGRCLSSEAP